jgi:hypothetical protein
LILFNNQDENTYNKESQIEVSRHTCRNCVNFNQNQSLIQNNQLVQIQNNTSTAIINKADALDGIGSI